jgi:hypothetical protein
MHTGYHRWQGLPAWCPASCTKQAFWHDGNWQDAPEPDEFTEKSEPITFQLFNESVGTAEIAGLSLI